MTGSLPGGYSSLRESDGALPKSPKVVGPTNLDDLVLSNGQL
jgi:hypothetical protein